MTKIEFISSLRDKLHGLPEDAIEDGINFYLEIINDKIEDGVPQEDAILQLGSVDKIASQIIGDIPFTKLAKNKLKRKKGLSPLAITLIAVGSPIWFSLLISAFAIVISLYASLWSVIISLWAVAVSVGIGGFCGIIYAIVLFFTSSAPLGIVTLGTSFACIGIFGFLLYGCRIATKCTVTLTKILTVGIKKCFIGKGDK